MKAIFKDNKWVIGVPRQWIRTATPDKTTLGYDKLDDQDHYDDGWKEFIEPPLLADQYYGDVISVAGTPTREVKTYTASEILNRQVEAQTSRQVGDAQEAVRDIFRDLRKKKMDGTITADQYLKSIDILYNALSPMYDGLWELTKKRIDAIVEPLTQPYKDIYLNVKQRIDSYVV